jgi:hypothetical protein
MEDAQHYLGFTTVVSTLSLRSSGQDAHGTFRAILTILQIDSAAGDPITRYCALFSLICALMSLLFGCIYIIRFGTMRKPHKAAEWAAVRTLL